VIEDGLDQPPSWATRCNLGHWSERMAKGQGFALPRSEQTSRAVLPDGEGAVKGPGGMRHSTPSAAAHGTRERILRAARDLYARRGFARVSMREVAAAAGVTKPALYYHFRDKESLFEECLTEFNAELSGTVREATRRGGDMTVRVRAVAEALLTGSPFHPVRVHDELAEQVSGQLRERLRSTFRSVVVEPVTELFATMQRSGELRPGVSPPAAAALLIGTCAAFLGSAQGEPEAWTPLPIDDLQTGPAAAAEVVSDLVLCGVAAPTRGGGGPR